MPQTLSLGTIFTGRVDAKFRGAVASLDRSLVALNTLMGKTTKATAAATTASTRVAAAQNKAAAAADKHKKKLDPLNKQISKVHGALNRFRAALKVTAAYGVAAAGIFAVVNALKAGVMEIINFDQALRNLEAITGALPADIALMADKMRQVAITTKFSTTEIAEGMVLIGQAGFDAAEGVNTIQAVADLASGTLSSLKDTADLVTSAIRAFGLDSIDAGRIVDVFANSINKSKLTIDKLRTSFNYIGASAHQVGLSLEDTAATMMLLANNGLRASTIGTGFRQVLARMIAPNRKLRTAFEEHGIAVEKISPAYEDATGEAQGFQKAMHTLSKVITKADGETVDMAKAFSLFGLRGAQAVAVIVDGFLSKKFDDAWNKVQEVGAAAKMAAIQAKGLAFQFKNLADKAKEFAIGIGDSGVKGILETIVFSMGKLVDISRALIMSDWGGLIASLTILSGAILAVVHAVSILGQVVTWLLGPLLKWEAFMALVSTAGGPFALMVIALSAIYLQIKKQAEAHDKLILRLEKEEAALKGTTHSLNAYRGALEDTIDKMGDSTEVTKQHEALLKRLMMAHPELGELITATGLTFEDLGNAVKKANDELRRVGETAVFASLSTWRAQQKELEKMQRPAAIGYGAPEDMFSLAVGATKEQIEAQKTKVGKGLKEIGRTILVHTKELARQWKKEGEGGELWAPSYARDFIRELGVSKEDAATLTSVIVPAIEKYIEALKKADKVTGKIKKEKELKELFKLTRRYYSLLASSETDQTKKINHQFEVRKNAIKQYLKDRATAYKKQGVKDGKLDEDTHRLNKANEKKRDKELADLEFARALRSLRLKQSLIKIGFEEEKRASIGNEKAIADVIKRQKESDIEFLKQSVVVEKSLYDEVERVYGEGSDEQKKAAIDLNKTKLALAEATTDFEIYKFKESHKEDVKNLKDRLKLTREFSDEWLAIQKELHDKGKLSEAAYAEAVKQNMIRQMSWWEKLKHGIEEAKIKGTEFKDVWIEIGSEVATTVADNMTTSLLDFAKGAVSAKDAFVDFAESTLDWLFKMIVRQQIYNALIGFAPSLGPATSSATTKTSPTPGMREAHSGGVLGKDVFPKRYHGGGIVRQNEVPIIAEKGEGIFTKGQMSAMGGPKNISVNIINKSDTKLEATTAEPKFNMGQLILNVVLEGATRNKSGFRDGMRGALS